jgi:hypothetical protein
MALATGPASATVLYQQDPVGGGLGYYANLNSPQQMADDFNLSGAVLLESITWWGGYDGNVDIGDDDFLVRLYSSTTGTGTVLQEYNAAPFTRTSTALADIAGNDVYQYDFVLPTSLSLSAGTRHLFVQNLGTSDWFWLEGAPGNGTVMFRGEDTDDWTSYDSADLALRIEGTPGQAPEPSSLALLGVAGLSMALAGRRRKRRSV